MGPGRTIAVWVCAFVVVALAFYALDHAVMSAQGLPLALDLSPAR